MIAIDTNILVRYLTQDDEKLASIATRFLEQHVNKTNYIYINNIVICELIWVLERGYRYTKTQITEVIKEILTSSEFCFENRELLWLSLENYRMTKADYSDIVICLCNKSKGCENTFTFNQAAIAIGMILCK